jgi:hypothetical protein
MISQEKSDHGKKEQVEKAQSEEASDGKSQARRCQTHIRKKERRKKEIAADEGEAQGKGEVEGEVCAEEGCAQEGNGETGAETRAETRARAGGRSSSAQAKTRRPHDAGADGATAVNAGRGASRTDINRCMAGPETDGDVNRRGSRKSIEWQFRRVPALEEGARRYCPEILAWPEYWHRRACARRVRL